MLSSVLKSEVAIAANMLMRAFVRECLLTNSFSAELKEHKARSKGRRGGGIKSYLCIPRHFFAMNKDLAAMHYLPIRDYKYAQWFEEAYYNGKTLSDAERREFVVVIDENIAQYSVGLPLMHDSLEEIKNLHDGYHNIERAVVSVMFFVLVTMIDSMVASK